MSQFFTSGGQSIGVSASTSVLPMNIQDWFPLGWISWTSLLLNGLSRVFSSTRIQKHQFFDAHNMLSRLVITFLLRSRHLLISWLQSPSAVILERKKVSHCFPIYSPCNDGTRWHDLRFWMSSLKPTFSLSSFTFINRLFISSLCAIRVVSSAYLKSLIFLQATLIPAWFHPAQHFS